MSTFSGFLFEENAEKSRKKQDFSWKIVGKNGR
jgi:hypothetical protein